MALHKNLSFPRKNSRLFFNFFLGVRFIFGRSYRSCPLSSEDSRHRTWWENGRPGDDFLLVTAPPFLVQKDLFVLFAGANCSYLTVAGVFAIWKSVYRRDQSRESRRTTGKPATRGGAGRFTSVTGLNIHREIILPTNDVLSEIEFFHKMKCTNSTKDAINDSFSFLSNLSVRRSVKRIPTDNNTNVSILKKKRSDDDETGKTSHVLRII